MSEEKTYTLRDMTAEDVFPVFKIISCIGMKEVKNCFEDDEVKAAMKAMIGDTEGENPDATAEGENPDVTAVGITVAVNIADVLFNNLPKCKDHIYHLLANLSGMNKNEIAALPMATFMNMVVDIIMKEEFKDFFQAAARLLK